MSDEQSIRWIAGFWRRIGALTIDSILLAVVGLLIGFTIKEQLVEMGSWGRLIGFVIALSYFGLMNSKLNNGQTLGKKLLKVRVVNFDNQTISIPRSFLRYSILAVPFFLNNAHFSNELMFSFWIYPLTLIIFGGVFSATYLYLFNRVTRQSIHDLAVGTFVVNASVDRQEPGSVWKPHLYVVGALFLLAAIVPAVTSQLVDTEPFKEMLATQSELISSPQVTYATVAVTTKAFVSAREGESTTHSVDAKIFLAEDLVNSEELAREFGEIILRQYPNAMTKDVVNISLVYGFDIGIASQWVARNYSFKPAELQALE
jgi:uncharacterized RDD family membrane protein YckC